MIKKIKEKIKHPLHLFLSLGHRGFFNWLSDEKYLKIAYRIKFGKNLNLIEPKSFNEKLQWLKLYDFSPEYTNYVDKLKVRKHVKETIGNKYLIPLIGVWDNFEDIDFNKMPKKFVLKCNHDSGSVVICRDKKNLDMKSTKKLLNKGLKSNYFWGTREKPYKYIEPKIIAEKLIEDNLKTDLKDYKFFCFNGNVKALFVASERDLDTKFDFFDREFNELPIKQYYENSKNKPEKPKELKKMIELAEILSQDMLHVRVDFYNVNEEIYFGELTFYHFSGLVKFENEESDIKLGSWINLDKQ